MKPEREGRDPAAEPATIGPSWTRWRMPPVMRPMGRIVAGLWLSYQALVGMSAGIEGGWFGLLQAVAVVLLAADVATRGLLILVGALAFAGNLAPLVDWPIYPLLPVNLPALNALVFAAAGAGWLVPSPAGSSTSPGARTSGAP